MTESYTEFMGFKMVIPATDISGNQPEIIALLLCGILFYPCGS